MASVGVVVRDVFAVSKVDRRDHRGGQGYPVETVIQGLVCSVRFEFECVEDARAVVVCTRGRYGWCV